MWVLGITLISMSVIMAASLPTEPFYTVLSNLHPNLETRSHVAQADFELGITKDDLEL